MVGMPLYGVDEEMIEAINQGLTGQGVINSLLLLEDLVFVKNQVQCAIIRIRASQNPESTPVGPNIKTKMHRNNKHLGSLTDKIDNLKLELESHEQESAQL